MVARSEALEEPTDGSEPVAGLDRTRGRQHRPPLLLLVIVVGAAALGIEIAAVRLLAPYFGASELVWANTIGVVLVALSAGYWYGGKVADRRPSMSALCVVVSIAAALTAALPFVASPLLDAGVDALEAIEAGAFVGSLAATLLLIATPVFAMGMVAPWALRIGIDDIDPVAAGALAGRLYAVSTAGSLIGTLMAALVLIPGLGTRRTFLVFALLLAIVAWFGIARRLRASMALLPLVIAALFLLPAGSVKGSASDGRVIHEEETAEQYVRVIERSDGSRVLELNEGQAIHSLYRPESVLTGDYWDTALVLPLATLGAAPKSIAVLGNAAGTIARAYGRFFPATDVYGVEIDGELAAIGRRYFGLGGANFHPVTADARPFLREHDRRYDAIVLDAYRQPYIPFCLTTHEFFKLAQSRLSDDGAVIINVGHPEDSDELVRVLAATLGSVFPHVWLSPTEPTNAMLIASNQPFATTSMLRAAAGASPQLVPVAETQARIARHAPLDGEIYTDDRAPVEWLIDRSIVSYAAGK